MYCILLCIVVWRIKILKGVCCTQLETGTYHKEGDCSTFNTTPLKTPSIIWGLSQGCVHLQNLACVLAFGQLHLLAWKNYCLDNFKRVVRKRLFGQLQISLVETVVSPTASIVRKICTRHNCRFSLKALQISSRAVSELLSKNLRRISSSLARTSKDIRACRKFNFSHNW